MFPMQTSSESKGLSGAAIKWLALITMTVDHVGVLFFPNVILLRVIGRLAFPLFGYMIAEGCAHTHDKGAYLARTAGLALLCQIVYFFAEGSLYMCILVTFSLAIVWIIAIDRAKADPSALTVVTVILTSAAVVFVCVGLPALMPGTDFSVDYGLFGVVYVVCVYLGRSKTEKLLLGAAALIGVALTSLIPFAIQICALFALIPLYFYNGSRGKYNIKLFFYVYYPLHLAVLEGIYMLTRHIGA